MSNINYPKLFSNLSHIKALSYDSKFDEIVQNIIINILNVCDSLCLEKQITEKIKDVYGISIRLNVVQSNLDKLLGSKKIVKDFVSKKISLSVSTAKALIERNKDAEMLENAVKFDWFKGLLVLFPDIEECKFDTFWKCLKSYLCNVFEQHGIETLGLLDPNTKISQDSQKNLETILEQIVHEYNIDSIELLKKIINSFFYDADHNRVEYLSQLADATFTSFALTADDQTVKFLNSGFNNFQLFLDTNFIFGILNLHNNNEDDAAKEIIEEVKKNNFPFSLKYHPETLAEFQRTFDSKALRIKATNWTRESSRIALEMNELSPLERLFHKQNLENEIDPTIFLEKYDQVSLILRDLGLIEYKVPTTTTDLEYADIEVDIDEYQKFYELTPHRKGKSFAGFKHDIVVLREVRKLNPRKTKFIESNAFFISSDFILGKFEKKYYKNNREINYVVTPSVFLQLLRPFIRNDYQSNKHFVDTFSIPEFRAFEIDYSTTRSKILQILNDDYNGTSYETKVKILRNQVILNKFDKLNDDREKQIELIEKQISISNQLLANENKDLSFTLCKIEEEKGVLLEKNKNIINEHIKAVDTLSEQRDELEKLRSRLTAVEESSKEKDRWILQKEWEDEREVYIREKMDETRKQYKESAIYCIRPMIGLVLVVIVVPMIFRFNKEIEDFFQRINFYSEICFVLIYILLGGISFYELLYRTYIFNKEKVRDGILWMSVFQEKKKDELVERSRSEYEKEYKSLNPMP